MKKILKNIFNCWMNQKVNIKQIALKIKSLFKAICAFINSRINNNLMQKFSYSYVNIFFIASITFIILNIFIIKGRCSNVNSQDLAEHSLNSESVKINSLKVDVIIDDENRYHYTENYNLKLLNSNNDINVNNGNKYRNKIFEVIIPIDNSKGYIQKFLNIDADNFKYKKIKTKNNMVIRIDLGSNKNLDLSKSFDLKLSYIIDKGEDYNTKNDYIDVFLVSPYLKSDIDKFGYEIKFPKRIASVNFDYDLLTHTNINDEINKSDLDIKYLENETIIKGDYKNIFPKNRTLKISANLYDKFFENVRDSKKEEFKVVGLYLVCLGICFVHFFLCGRDTTLMYKVKSNVPNGISPLLIKEFFDMKNKNIIKNNIEKDKNKVKNLSETQNDHLDKIRPNHHFSSMLIKWANQGFINIEIEDKIANGEDTLNKKDYKIKKLKEAGRSDIPYYEKIIFDGLAVLAVDNVIDTELIRNNFDHLKECVKYFKKQTNNSEEAVSKYIEKIEENKKDSVATKTLNNLKILSILSFVLAIIFTGAIYQHSFIYYALSSVFIFILSFEYYKVLNISDNHNLNFLISFTVLLLGYFTININVLSYLILSLTTLLILSVRKYSFEYEIFVEKIKSFKRFISRKKDRVGIVNALAENSKYFYEAIPYAIVFESIDTFTKRCNEFPIAMPGWLSNTHPKHFKIEMIQELASDLDLALNDIIYRLEEK